MWALWQPKSTRKSFAPIVGKCLNCSLKNA